ncbi:MAG TPA: hypothetical protein VNO50_03570 [Pyrinomonadaceae bacterium]|nr:hypothetical protein [Pyrinomonadaceae bacterium]
MDTKTINLRELPEDFVKRAKAQAALSGLTLKDFVIKAVETAMQATGHETTMKAERKSQKKKA